MGLAGRPIDFKRIAALTNVVTDLQKTVAANFRGAHWYGGQYDNTVNAAQTFIQFFNAKAADVTLGVTSPDYVLSIPAGEIINFQFDADAPLLYNLGFSAAATTTRTGAVAPAVALEVTPYFIEV